MKEDFLGFFVPLIIIGLGILGSMFAFRHGMENWEKERCYTLQKQAQEGYEGFYITNQESVMCREQEIIVEAPILH